MIINQICIFLGYYLVSNYHIFTATGYTIGLLEILSLNVTLMFVSISRYLLTSKDTVQWRIFDILVSILTSFSLCVFLCCFYYSYLLEADIFKTKLDLWDIHIEKLYLNYDARNLFINACWDKYYSNVVDFVYLKYGDTMPSVSIPSKLLEVVNKMDNKMDVEVAISKYCNQLKLDSIRDSYWDLLVNYTRHPLFVSILFLFLFISIFKLNIDVYSLMNNFIDLKSDMVVLNTKKDELVDAFNQLSVDFTDDVSRLNSTLDKKVEYKTDDLSKHLYIQKQRIDAISAYIWPKFGNAK